MAGGITEAVIEEVKARTDLADLVAAYGIAVKTAGGSTKACCPFHNEKTPSFNINTSKGFYHCFGCGESGDAIKFVQRMDGVTFPEAVKRLAAQCGVKIEEGKEEPSAVRRRRLYALLAELAGFYSRCLAQTREAEAARACLKERALDGRIQEEYGIGYAPAGVAAILKWAEKAGYTPAEVEAAGVIRTGDRPGDKGYHRFGGRLMFPIRDRRGRVAGFSGRQIVASKNSGKYVNSPETEVFKKSNILYGFDKAAAEIAKAPNREAIVCEGQIDCIRLQTCGFPNSVAGQGTAFTPEHAAMLSKVADQVALLYDDDEAGHKASVKTARLCLAAGMPVRVVSLPGGDDPDSFLRSHPPEALRSMLDRAESIVAFQVRAARLREKNPGSVDAVARISRETLETVAQCPNAVVRAAMASEAAGLLGLPAAAVAAELEKALAAARGRAQSPRRGRELPEAADGSGADDGAAEQQEAARDEAPMPGEDAAEAAPPPARESALCSFLLANEYDKTLADAAAPLLRRDAFASPFSAAFADVWFREAETGDDLFGEFADSLPAAKRKWFDRILADSGKSCASALAPEEQLRELLRGLWSDALSRMRGGLPADGAGPETLRLRLEITADLKRLPVADWDAAKEIISKYMKGDER